MSEQTAGWWCRINLFIFLRRRCFEPPLHLFTHHWGCQRHERACARPRACVSMCGGRYNKLIWWQCVSAIDPRVPHLAATHVGPAVTAVQSGDRCGLQTHKRNTKRACECRTLGAASEEARKWIPPLWWSFTYFNLTQMLLTVGRDDGRHQILWVSSFLYVVCFI